MLYLASTSPRRKKILRDARIDFRVLRPSHDEASFSGKRSPSQWVQQHALAKARSVSHRVSEGVILGADTIVYFHGKIIGKPKNLKEASKILSQLQGRWHTVYTGVALLGKSPVVFYDKTRVFLKKMSPADVRGYFKKVNPLDKAGAYAIQSKKNLIVLKVKGDFFNAVGLPMKKLKIQLKGIHLQF